MIKIWIRTFLIGCLLFTFSWTNAQDYIYEVQIATYAAPDYKNFHKLFHIGYVYTVDLDNGLSRIYMGTYDRKSTADRKAKLVRSKGFDDAFVVKKPVRSEDAVYVVQLGTYDQQADIYWADWQRLTSHLCAQLSDSRVRVCAGPYYTREEAEEARQRIHRKGPHDVFVKKVSEEALHKVGDFDLKRSPSYGQQTGKVRNSIKALQLLLAEEDLYDARPNGVLTQSTKGAIIKFKKTNEQYLSQLVASQKLDLDIEPARYTLQYYINLIEKDPSKALAGLKQFKHPIADIFVAYLYLNEDVAVNNKIITVNKLMNAAMQRVFKNYRGKTRYDFSLKYSYDDMQQLLSHLKAMYEVVKDRPDIPCWMFERHPKMMEKAFAPYWNNRRDDYSVSVDCGTFMDSEEMQMLWQVSKSFASKEMELKKIGGINKYYITAKPLSHQEMEKLEKWNGMLWRNLKSWSSASPLQKNMYTLLRFCYYDALHKLENHFMQKGLPGIEARSLGLKVIKESVGCNLNEYCKE